MTPNLPYGGRAEQIGALTVLPVFDGYSREEPTHMFITSDGQQRERGHRREDWQPYADQFLDENGLLEHGLGGFLLRTGTHVVLIDAGVGPGQIGPYGPHNRVIVGGELPTRLRELGVDPGEITDVVFTHLHPDHYGWATSDNARMFPNATFRCHTADWQHFVVRPGDAISPYSAQLLALQERLETWDGDVTLFPGITMQHAPGHTPGSTVVVLSSGTARGILLGDVVHCPVELLDVEWASLGDADPALARRTRDAMAREIEGTDVVVTGPHFPGMRFGRLLPGQVNRTWSLT